ncbi:MAG: hypothetical protein IOC39_24240 [Burkholderia sp.]|jgi:hypothetical protein|uniref:hypothetical protein n=1 Tax=Burkholderia sp. TaxID=36773 RepID=UPI00258AAFA8|nr:hypothetical protein [Burkholderia sp.]MCA3780127.1 hypothetical protein [Burkholderia sp.]MCA3787382.1 hypothetical protein [Burkholderia sp.]MCA3796261.1 hypothetical protein [Burkholderia sp.]MCA3810855.1 hypothetical protein [Burkholderia sp.]MCA3818931.1 hypothetical protein [Burkholderia sp.]
MKLATLLRLLMQAYETGFDESREGFNGEHMVNGAVCLFERNRDEAIGRLLAEAIKRGELDE